METNRRQVAELTRTVTRTLDAARRGQSRVFDQARVGVLTLIVERGPLRAGAIAEELDVLPSSVTRHVQALEDAGFVATATDPADRRATLVEATTTGREQLRQFEAVGVEVFHAVIADWPAADVAQLTELLNRLIASWEAKGAEQQRAAGGRQRFNWSQG